MTQNRINVFHSNCMRTESEINRVTPAHDVCMRARVCACVRGSVRTFEKKCTTL